MNALSVPFRPFARSETYGSLLFFAAAAPVGAAALALLIGGWVAAGVLLVTPLVVVVLLSFRGAVGLLSAGDAVLARELLGTTAAPRVRSGGAGFWRRGLAVAQDTSFWLQQAYLALRMTIGFGLAVAELSLLAAALGCLAYPITYRWTNLHFGSWQVDTFTRSLVMIPIGLVGLSIAGWLAVALGRMWAHIVETMLGGETNATPRPVSPRARRLALVVHGAVAATIAVLLVVIWTLSSHRYFWPEWAILPLALLFACHFSIELVDLRPDLRLGRTRGFAIQLGLSAALFGFFILVWALTTRAYFWPVWPALGLVLALGAHLTLEWTSRGSRLARRVDILEETRAGAVDVEESKLRRIERDLHDGAQARLISLGMTLGLAEQRFAADPQGAQQLLAEARGEVGETLQELRDLARGIHPPVLADRGLCAALSSLAAQSRLPVVLACDLDRRLAPTVEIAAYFVAAEAIANATKHADARQIDVSVRRRGNTLELEIVDDGRGGADPAGNGLTGMQHRVRALDGTLDISSPEGGPTVIHAELPCAS